MTDQQNLFTLPTWHAVKTLSAVTVLGLLVMPASAHNPWGWQGPTIRVQEVSGLDFGTIAPDQQAPGIVRVRPQHDRFSRCGHPLICLAGGTRGRFRISSSRTRYLHIDLSHEAILTNNLGDSMRVSRFRAHGRNVSHGCVFVRKNHPELVGVGATLHVGAQQPPGHYRGTYEITVTYE